MMELKTAAVLKREKLLPESVQRITRNISDFFYVVKSSNSCYSNQRLSILLMLQEWCANKGKHFRIDSNNYDCFVNNYVNCVLFSSSNVPDNMDIKSECDEFGPHGLNIPSANSLYYEKLIQSNNNKAKYLELIRERDYESCRDGDIFDCDYDAIPKQIKVFNYLQEIELINDQNSCTVCTKVEKNSGTYNRKIKTEPRDILTNLAYALLNICTTHSDTSLLFAILRKINSFGQLEPDEVTLINYVWRSYEKLNLPMEIAQVLLENFSFVYEKYFINLCTSILKQDVTDINLLIAFEDTQRVLRIIRNNAKLCYNLINLLYELYACSTYNTKLYNFLAVIKQLL